MNAQHLLNNKLTPLIFTILFFVNTNQISATHIIGGVMTYSFEEEINADTNNYSINFSVFYECDLDNAIIDIMAPLALYEKIGTEYVLVDMYHAPMQGLDDLENNNFACVVSPNSLCVKEASYLLSLDINISDNSYFLVFQRCCRYESIGNLTDPLISGSTYFLELTAEAQALQNSAIVFENTPPTILCVGEPLNVDVSAIDLDGDSIVYEFCSPLLGGGSLIDSTDLYSCQGYTPTPPCPPPYENVQFTAPYSPLNPFGGNPIIELNPTTGILTGIINVQGQYAFGVCVKEYRNGILINSTQRDFQINSTFCPQLVTADVEHDLLQTSGDPMLVQCGPGETIIINQSQLIDSIHSFFWTFNIDNQLDTLYEWSPTLLLQEPGVYNGTLYLNPYHPCQDSLDVQVQVFPKLDANFTFDAPDCESNPISFSGAALSMHSVIQNYAWSFGVEDTSSLQSPTYPFMEIGNHPVTLIVEDEWGCEDTIVKEVDWFPSIPCSGFYNTISTPLCPPVRVDLQNTTASLLNNNYTITWKLNDSLLSHGDTTTMFIENSGNYDLLINTISPVGCASDTMITDFVFIPETPVADFGVNNGEKIYDKETVGVDDYSLNTIYHTWYLNDRFMGYDENFEFFVDGIGFYEIALYAQNEALCADTLVKSIEAIPNATYFLPNTFSPNGDGVNDVYKGKGDFSGIKNFELSIWNRWGELIFFTKDPTEHWDGTRKRTEKETALNVFLCKVSFLDSEGNQHALTEKVLLLK